MTAQREEAGRRIPSLPTGLSNNSWSSHAVMVFTRISAAFKARKFDKRHLLSRGRLFNLSLWTAPGLRLSFLIWGVSHQFLFLLLFSGLFRDDFFSVNLEFFQFLKLFKLWFWITETIQLPKTVRNYSNYLWDYYGNCELQIFVLAGSEKFQGKWLININTFSVQTLLHSYNIIRVFALSKKKLGDQNLLPYSLFYQIKMFY